MRCKAKTAAIDQLWRGFATPQSAQSKVLRAASDLFSVALKPWFKRGPLVGTLMTGIEQWLMPKLGMKVPPWTVRGGQAEHFLLRPADQCPKIDYPKPDNRITFDRLCSVFIRSTNHEVNQPAHLTLKDNSVPVAINLARNAEPEARYCPAGVTEFVENDDHSQRLQINAQTCVHGEACDIKDPTQNIVWGMPEGGGGPNYAGCRWTKRPS